VLFGREEKHKRRLRHATEPLVTSGEQLLPQSRQAISAAATETPATV